MFGEVGSIPIPFELLWLIGVKEAQKFLKFQDLVQFQDEQPIYDRYHYGFLYPRQQNNN